MSKQKNKAKKTWIPKPQQATAVSTQAPEENTIEENADDIGDDIVDDAIDDPGIVQLNFPPYASAIMVNAWNEALLEMTKRKDFEGEIPLAYTCKMLSNGSMMMSAIELPPGAVLATTRPTPQYSRSKGVLETANLESQEPGKGGRRPTRGPNAKNPDKDSTNTAVAASPNKRLVISPDGGLTLGQ